MAAGNGNNMNNMAGRPDGMRPAQGRPANQNRPRKKKKHLKSLIPTDDEEISRSNEMPRAQKPVQKPAQKPAPKPVSKPVPGSQSHEAPVSSREPSRHPVKKNVQKHVKPQKNDKIDKKKTEESTEKVVEAIEKKERKKKKTLDSHVKAERNAVRNGIFGAIAAAAALLVLAFVVYHLVSYVAEKPRLSFVTEGSIEHTIGAKALIVREESTVLSGTSGELVTSVTEGSRVAASQNLAIVVPEDKKSMVTDLRNVQSQISDIQQELIEEGNVEAAKTVYETYNKNLEPIIDSIRFDSSTGKLQSLATYTSSISVLLDERETALSEIDFNDERLSVLRNDEEMYQSSLQRSSSSVKAPKPGIVSFRLDGQENELNFDKVMTADRGEVRKLINSSVGAIPANFNISAQQEVCRIVQNEKQLFAVFLNSRDAAATDFAVGTKHDLNIAAEGLVVENCEVVRCDSDKNGMLIVFSTTRYVEDLLDLRTVDIEIVITKSSGLRVSMSSIVNEELAPSDSVGFSVVFDPDSGVITDNFTPGAFFNINIIPDPVTAEDGTVSQADPVTIAGCEVLHCEQTESGGVLVGFATTNEYAAILKVNTKYPDGYQAVFIDTTTGLGTNVKKITTSNYKGIASIYVNNQGFVAEHRVIVTDYDREFAIIIPEAGSKVPDLDTVIIVNPTSCKPDDKVV